MTTHPGQKLTLLSLVLAPALGVLFTLLTPFCAADIVTLASEIKNQQPLFDLFDAVLWKPLNFLLWRFSLFFWLDAEPLVLMQWASGVGISLSFVMTYILARASSLSKELALLASCLFGGTAIALTLAGSGHPGAMGLPLVLSSFLFSLPSISRVSENRSTVVLGATLVASLFWLEFLWYLPPLVAVLLVRSNRRSGAAVIIIASLLVTTPCSRIAPSVLVDLDPSNVFIASNSTPLQAAVLLLELLSFLSGWIRRRSLSDSQRSLLSTVTFCTLWFGILFPLLPVATITLAPLTVALVIVLFLSVTENRMTQLLFLALFVSLIAYHGRHLVLPKLLLTHSPLPALVTGLHHHGNDAGLLLVSKNVFSRDIITQASYYGETIMPVLEDLAPSSSPHELEKNIRKLFQERFNDGGTITVWAPLYVGTANLSPAQQSACNRVFADWIPTRGWYANGYEFLILKPKKDPSLRKRLLGNSVISP